MGVTFKSNADKAKRRAHAAAGKAVRDAADAIETDIVRAMFRSGGGRVYRRYPGRGLPPYTHVASRPGQAPAVDTQQLVKSVDVKQIADTTAVVGMRDKKARRLEFGTRRVAPRPSLAPALAREAKRFRRRLKGLE